MSVNIGENLKKLRLRKGLTQEQVAEAFGVSAQAVSRWENNIAYPDITLLPGIAIFYDTTIDAFVGMDEIRAEEALRRIHRRVHALVAHGEADAAVALIKESLKTYPNNSGLLGALGETLARRENDPAATQEAIGVAERLLQNVDISMKARCTATANLLFLYLKAGARDKACTLVRSLPHIWESREILLAETAEDGAYAQALRESIIKALVFLCQKIDGVSAHISGATPDYIQLGVDFTPQKSVADMLEQLRSFLSA